MRKNPIPKVIILSLFLAIIVSYLTVNSVKGHAPSSMTLTYHFDTETLDVEIFHSVSNGQTHFVESIDIWRNDILNHSADYTSQPGNTFTYNFNINATVGDELKVTAICNQGGSITRTITVSANGTTPTANTSINYICLVLIGVPFIGLIARIKSKREK